MPTWSKRPPPIIQGEVPDASVTLLERNRPHRPARTRKRRHPQCLSAPTRAADRRRLPTSDRRSRHRRAALPDPKRRHADERRFRRAIPGPDLRLRSDQLDARGGVSLRHEGRHGGRHRRHDQPTSARSRTGFPREASVAVDIGGVRTNFRMPDVYLLRPRRRFARRRAIRCGSARKASATASPRKRSSSAATR